MKLILRTLCIVAISLLPFILSSCSDDEVEKGDKYYVKYEITVGDWTGTMDRKNIWSIRCKTESENASFTVEGQTSWEASYGPFQKGDEVFLRVDCTMAKRKINPRIYVCKGGDAYVLKASATNVTSANLNYIIDL